MSDLDGTGAAVPFSPCCDMVLCIEAPNGPTGKTKGTTWARTRFR